MRVALLSWESLHSIPVGGVGVHVTQLAAALTGKGHAVHVFTRRAPGQAARDWVDGVHYHRCTYPPQADFVDDMNSMCRSCLTRSGLNPLRDDHSLTVNGEMDTVLAALKRRQRMQRTGLRNTGPLANGTGRTPFFETPPVDTLAFAGRCGGADGPG